MIVGVKNKCNITGYALEQLNALYFGYQCKDNQSMILENYIQYLSCPTVVYKTCFPDNCSNPTITNTCNIAIAGISFTKIGSIVTFFIAAEDITGATNPLLYSWGYDSTFFNIGAATNNSTLVLTLKAGVDFDSIVAGITVAVTDHNDCIGNKSCYLVGGDILCTSNYVQCPNILNLSVVSGIIPFFTLIANGLTFIDPSAFGIISTSDFTVDWGDGTIDSFLAGTRTVGHTYDDPYTGFITISCAILANITSLVIGGDLSSTILPISGALTVKTTELAKLTGLLVLELGNSIFVDGTVADLPDALTNLAIVETNLSGNTSQFARTLIDLAVTGLNTVTGTTNNLPVNLDRLTLWGFTTISGPVSGLPRSLTFFNVHGNNTISGLCIDLPPNLITTDLLGNNTLGGDIAGWPTSSNYIVVFGNNTIFGNTLNIPRIVDRLSILGNNGIVGTITNLPSNATFLQITGHNAISGDVALLPANATFINIDGTNTSINIYTPSIRTWPSILASVIINPHIIGLDEASVDNLLIELAAQVPTWVGDKVVRLLGANASRTAASNAAVATLVGLGVTVNTIP